MDSKEKMIHIQKAAFNLFLNNGYEATTIRTICKKAGVEAPTIYNFFNSKKGLFLSIVSSLWEKYLEESSCYFNDTSNISPDKKLFTFFRFSIKYTLENLDETRFFLRFSLFPPSEVQEDTISFLLHQQKHKYDYIGGIINDCIQQGLISAPRDQATNIFMKFVNSNTFDIIFSNWSPSEEELLEAWNTFFACLLSRNLEQ